MRSISSDYQYVVYGITWAFYLSFVYLLRPPFHIFLLHPTTLCISLPSASHQPLHLTNLCIPLYPLTRNCLFTFIKLQVFRFFQLTLTLRHGVKYNHGPDILSSYFKERKGFKIENKPGRGADRCYRPHTALLRQNRLIKAKSGNRDRLSSL